MEFSSFPRPLFRGTLLSFLHIIFQPCALEYLFDLVVVLSISGGCLHVMRCVPLVVEISFLNID